jgi:hypothetical protein
MKSALGDLDVLLVFPSESQAMLVAVAGQNSGLHKKHGVYLDVVTVGVGPFDNETVCCGPLGYC